MITVMGASGRTGRSVAAGLRARGVEVRGVARGDVLERSFAFADAAYVILPDDLRAPRFHADRRRMADAIAEAVRQARVPRVVLVSSAVASLGPDTRSFGADLAYLEALLLQTSAVVTVLRAAYFQDNVVTALPSAQRDGVYPSLFRSAAAPVRMVAASDVGAVAVRALLAPEAKREVIDVVGPAYSSDDVAAILGRKLGRPVTTLSLPPEARADMLSQMMSKEAALAMVATIDALSVGDDLLRGDRVEVGTTELAQVVEQAL